MKKDDFIKALPPEAVQSLRKIFDLTCDIVTGDCEQDENTITIAERGFYLYGEICALIGQLSGIHIIANQAKNLVWYTVYADMKLALEKKIDEFHQLVGMDLFNLEQLEKEWKNNFKKEYEA